MRLAVGWSPTSRAATASSDTPKAGYGQSIHIFRCLNIISSRSLLCRVLIAIHFVALTDASVAVNARVVAGIEVWAGDASVALTAVARAAQHVLAERTALLDRRLEVLVRLLLDGLRVL